MSQKRLSSEIGLAPQAQSLHNLLKDDTYGSVQEIMALPLARLVAILNDASASVYARAKACQRLAVIGDRTATAALAPLLTEAHLANYARAALETLPDDSADDVLRAALPLVTGTLLIGVINSLGRRRDIKAIPVLEKLRHAPDVQVSQAADAALARIRPPLSSI